MGKKLTALLLFAACTFLLSCASHRGGRPPDLTGEWKQPSDGIWYHIATIEDSTIRVYWYLPEDGTKALYWQGSFLPPLTADEPYSWESTNDYTEEYLTGKYEYNRTSREPTKTFTYQDGKISYHVTAGHLRMTYALERADGESGGKEGNGT